MTRAQFVHAAQALGDYLNGLASRVERLSDAAAGGDIPIAKLQGLADAGAAFRADVQAAVVTFRAAIAAINP